MVVRGTSWGGSSTQQCTMKLLLLSGNREKGKGKSGRMAGWGCGEDKHGWSAMRSINQCYKLQIIPL
jgi:hypothetical protein